jgi:Spy/CpxP family protein refolding chaperone
MRRLRGFALLAGVFVIGLALAAAAQAQPASQGGQGQHMGPRGQGMGWGGGLAALKLTDEQQKALQALMESARTSNQPLVEALRTAESAYLTALYTDPTGTLPFQPVLDAETALVKARQALQVQFAQLLTPDQLQIALSKHIVFPPMGPPMGGRMRGTGK